MGAIPERRSSLTARNSGHEASRTKQMGASENPGISLVTTARNTPAWHKSVFNMDNGFRGLMLLAALTVLGIVGLIVMELLQKSSMAWHSFGLHCFVSSQWDPVSGSFGAVPFVYGTLVSSLIALI